QPGVLHSTLFLAPPTSTFSHTDRLQHWLGANGASIAGTPYLRFCSLPQRRTLAHHTTPWLTPAPLPSVRNTPSTSETLVIDQVQSLTLTAATEFLVKNFLDVARAEEGRLRIMLIQFDIGDVVELTLKNYEQQAAKKNIQIHYVKPITPATVYADESLTLQVLDNLISNALKYTAPGKDVAVDIQVVQVLRHNVTLFNNEMNNLDESAFVQCVRVSVTDEGPGLTDQDKTKLFGKFARLSAQPTGGESSTGLGLAITKRLIETMNGRIWCESEYGFGSRFTFELPSEVVS
nr:HAMP domain-containing histidine kinase [Candidatus Kapabacteria bacterium]